MPINQDVKLVHFLLLIIFSNKKEVYVERRNLPNGRIAQRQSMQGGNKSWIVYITHAFVRNHADGSSNLPSSTKK